MGGFGASAQADIRYNVGRDYMVGNLTGDGFNTRSVTNTTTISGTSKYANYTYSTDVKYVPGLLKNSSGESHLRSSS